jgi:hypothetical protein
MHLSVSWLGQTLRVTVNPMCLGGIPNRLTARPGAAYAVQVG